MLPFESDYNNGAHPNVLRHLVETNNQNSLTYGFDQWSKSARENIEFTIWEPYNDESKVCRFVTSWATTEKQISELEKLL